MGWGGEGVLPIIGSLSCDNGDGNENGKKALGSDKQNNTMHVHHSFLYIS